MNRLAHTQVKVMDNSIHLFLSRHLISSICHRCTSWHRRSILLLPTTSGKSTSALIKTQGGKGSRIGALHRSTVQPKLSWPQTPPNHFHGQTGFHEGNNVLCGWASQRWLWDLVKCYVGCRNFAFAVLQCIDIFSYVIFHYSSIRLMFDTEQLLWISSMYDCQ